MKNSHYTHFCYLQFCFNVARSIDPWNFNWRENVSNKSCREIRNKHFHPIQLSHKSYNFCNNKQKEANIPPLLHCMYISYIIFCNYLPILMYKLSLDVDLRMVWFSAREAFNNFSVASITYMLNPRWPLIWLAASAVHHGTEFLKASSKYELPSGWRWRQSS